jgi:hypothetical protein
MRASVRTTISVVIVGIAVACGAGWWRSHQNVVTVERALNVNCAALAEGLRRDAQEFGLTPAPVTEAEASNAMLVRSSYTRALSERWAVAAGCLGSRQLARDCIPTDLSAKTISAIERAAVSVETRRNCTP